MIRAAGVALLCCLGLAFLSFWGESRFRRSESDIVDFTSIVAGGYLVGTPGLYDVDANLALQRRLTGKSDSSRVFPRWPYYGAAIQPLAKMPYSDALRLWRYLMFGALAVFLFVFAGAPKWQTALTLCWSIPALDGLTQGQDSPLLLVFLALTVLAHRNGHEFVAGLLLSLCAAKYHLFVLVPVLIIAQKRWRFLAGGVCGGAVLVALSIAVQGPGWIAAHIQNIRRPEIDTYPAIMPNLRGLVGDNRALELCAAAAVVALVAYGVRYTGFEPGMAMVIIGGLLVSHHAYLHDLVLLIPGALLLPGVGRVGGVAKFLLLSPVLLALFYLWPGANLLYVPVMLVLLVEAVRA